MPVADAAKWIRDAVFAKFTNTSPAERATTIVVLDAGLAGVLSAHEVTDAYLTLYGNPHLEFGLAGIWLVGPTSSTTRGWAQDACDLAERAELSTANPIIDDATGLAFVEKVNELARQHRITCVQCPAYRGTIVAEDQRPANWAARRSAFLWAYLLASFGKATMRHDIHGERAPKPA